MDPLTVYKALADESRLRLVNILGQGTFNVQELTSILELSQPTVSHHLKTLHQAGLVKPTREGTWTFYTLTNTEEDAAAQITRSFLDIIKNSQNGINLPYRSDLSRLNQISDRRRDESRRYFDSVAKQWREVRREAIGDNGALETLVHRIPRDGVFLELGCGSGVLLERILPRTGETIAVDGSQAMLDEAAALLGKNSQQCDLRLGKLEHLPLADGSVDCAAAFMVLHHLPQPLDALREIFRVLRPEGQVMIVDLTAHDKEFMRERFADVWLGFDTSEMEAWIKSLGFSDISCNFFGSKKDTFFMTAVKPKKKEKK